MAKRNALSFFLLLPLTLGGCSSMSNAVEALALGAGTYFIVEPLGPNWQVEEARIAENRFQISLRKKRFATGGDGEAAPLFHRRAAQIATQAGASGYTILEFSEGIESTIPIAQRFARGIIEVKSP